MFKARMTALRERLAVSGINVALITDEDSVYYYTGYYDYLHMDFGRPTLLVISVDGASVLITPSMEKEMAQAAAGVDRIELWNDGMGNEWREALPGLLVGSTTVGIEPDLIPPVVRSYVDSLVSPDRLTDLMPLVSEMRMVKSFDELQIARHAGQVGIAMMDAARSAIGESVPEYEVALAATQAGTRKAAELLNMH